MDLYLHTLIYQIIADLQDSSIHNIIYARYFFLGRQMHSFEPVHINRSSVKELRLSQEGLRCRMMLDAGNSEESFSIMIPFSCIQRILAFNRLADQKGKTVFRQGKSVT